MAHHDDLLTELLDSTDDLNQLSDRQLLQRIARAQDRLEHIVTQASEYLDQALDGLDQQLQSLQSRLSADAAELQTALDQLAGAEGEHQALMDAAQRVQATADLVSGLALPSEVANPDSPAEATPIDQVGGDQAGGDQAGGEVVPGDVPATGTGDTVGTPEGQPTLDGSATGQTPPADVDQSY